MGCSVFFNADERLVDCDCGKRTLASGFEFVYNARSPFSIVKSRAIVLEINPLLVLIKNLTERTLGLRGYL
jgi:hypothetical protein